MQAFKENEMKRRQMAQDTMNRQKRLQAQLKRQEEEALRARKTALEMHTTQRRQSHQRFLRSTSTQKSNMQSENNSQARKSVPKWDKPNSDACSLAKALPSTVSKVQQHVPKPKPQLTPLPKPQPPRRDQIKDLNFDDQLFQQSSEPKAKDNKLQDSLNLDEQNFVMSKTDEPAKMVTSIAQLQKLIGFDACSESYMREQFWLDQFSAETPEFKQRLKEIKRQLDGKQHIPFNTLTSLLDDNSKELQMVILDSLDEGKPKIFKKKGCAEKSPVKSVQKERDRLRSPPVLKAKPATASHQRVQPSKENVKQNIKQNARAVTKISPVKPQARESKQQIQKVQKLEEKRQLQQPQIKRQAPSKSDARQKSQKQKPELKQQQPKELNKEKQQQQQTRTAKPNKDKSVQRTKPEQPQLLLQDSLFSKPPQRNNYVSKHPAQLSLDESKNSFVSQKAKRKLATVNAKRKSQIPTHKQGYASRQKIRRLQETQRSPSPIQYSPVRKEGRPPQISESALQRQLNQIDAKLHEKLAHV